MCFFFFECLALCSRSIFASLRLCMHMYWTPNNYLSQPVHSNGLPASFPNAWSFCDVPRWALIALQQWKSKTLRLSEQRTMRKCYWRHPRMRTTTNILCGSQVMVMLYSSYTSRVFDVALASWESSSGALAMMHTVYAMPSEGAVPHH